MLTQTLALFVAGSIASAAGAIAAESKHSPEIQRLITAAREKGEGELNLSWGSSLGGAAGAKRFEALLNRLYGINIRVGFTPAPSMTQMAGKVSLEVAAGQKPSTDILLGTESHYGDLLGRNVLEEYDYAKLSPRIIKEAVAFKNVGVEIAGIVPGITYNSDLVSPAEAPKKLADVLNPKWKGKIASTANAALFDRTAARPEWGAERMKGFVRKLSDQIGGLLRCQENNRIVSREFVMMVLNCGSYQIRREKAKGAPLEHIVPEDGSTVGFFHLGVPRNSAHPNLAKLYINALMSEEGQRMIYEMEFTDHYELPGSQSAAEIAHLKAKGIPVLKVGVKFIADHPELPKLSDELIRILRQR
ncbi:MAG TPA: extracellular solute-binding protein [Candidatus Binatia bacterium]